MPSFDVIVIGGGLFGCSIALAHAAQGARVVVLEREKDLFGRASYRNQARVHAGYHYPRSLLTARRSAVNYPRFVRDFSDCVDRTFEQVYAIAHGHSQVSAYQFARRCEVAGMPFRSAPGRMEKWFNPALIEGIFLVEECALNALRLRDRLRASMESMGVEIRLESAVTRIDQSHGGMEVHTDDETLRASQVIVCAYAGTNPILNRSGLPTLPLKHELTEMAMIRVPEPLKNVGITVMDGPFFSTMPFPALGLHSLSHVTYTPHRAWKDCELHESSGTPDRSAAIFMLRDAQRYVPMLSEAHHVTSLFETKTVLQASESDDGRPILCRRDYVLPGLTVIVGAKLDNIYDALQALDLPSPFTWELQALEAIA